MVDHDIAWLDITVDDTPGVAVVECSEQLVHVVFDVQVRQCGIEHLEQGGCRSRGDQKWL